MIAVFNLGPLLCLLTTICDFLLMIYSMLVCGYPSRIY